MVQEISNDGRIDADLPAGHLVMFSSKTCTESLMPAKMPGSVSRGDPSPKLRVSLFRVVYSFQSLQN